MRISPTRETAGNRATIREDNPQPGGIYPDLRRAIFLAAALFLLYRLAGPVSAIFLLFLLVFILAAVLNPVAAWLNGRGVPRIVSAIGLVLIATGALVGLFWMAAPPLLQEVSGFADRFVLGEYRLRERYEEFRARYSGLADLLPPAEDVVRRISPRIGDLIGRMSGYVMSILTGVVSLIILLVLVIYTVAQPEPLIAGFLSAVPPRYRDRANSTLRNSMEKLKQWAVGSLIVGVIVGVATGVGLHLLGVPYAFLFGVIAAIGELLPTLGPIISAIPPLLLALTIDPMTALWVLLFFVVLQQVEGNVLTPLVMGGKLELHPVSIVFAVLVMHALFGLFGALLAVPVCAIIKVCWEEFYLKPAGTDKNALEEEADSIAANESADEICDAGEEPAANPNAGHAPTSEPKDHRRAV